MTHKILLLLTCLLLHAGFTYCQIGESKRSSETDAEPYLSAGADLTITTLDSILVSARTRNLDSLVWRTDGTGTFTDTTAKRTYYTPSEADGGMDSIVINLIGYDLAGQDTLYTDKKIYLNSYTKILTKIGTSVRTGLNKFIYIKED